MADPLGDLRSNCPVNFGLEVFGDRWSLLIIRDIVFWGKQTYGDFLRSDEQIATNILSSRLTSLEEAGILKKLPHETDKRKDIYKLTEKGLDLIPLLVEIVSWSGKRSSWQAVAGGGSPQQIRAVKRFASARNRTNLAARIRKKVEGGGYFFEGVRQPVNPRKERRQQME